MHYVQKANQPAMFLLHCVTNVTSPMNLTLLFGSHALCTQPTGYSLICEQIIE